MEFIAIRRYRRPFLAPYWISMLRIGPPSFFDDLNVFLAPKNLGIDTKIMTFEFIVTEL